MRPLSTRRMRAASPIARLAAGALACTLCAPGVSHAAWTTNPGINTPTSTAAGDQVVPRSVDDGAGGTFIVWSDDRGGDKDIYAIHLDAWGNLVPGWLPSGNVICNQPGDQDNPVVVSDAAGGAIFAWSDMRSGNRDIYALRVRSNGTLPPFWPFGGAPVCTAPGDQGPVSAIPDGVGGIIMAWRDERAGNYDVYAMRLRGNGIAVNGWDTNGDPICTDPARQDLVALATDGNEGAFIVWQDERNLDIDIYGTRIRGNGRIRGGWEPNGNPLCNAAGDQFAPSVVYDDQRGMYVVWEDFRGGLTSDLYAIRVQQNGNPRRGWSTNGNPICTAANDQFTPQAKLDEWGNLDVVWEDYRSGIDNPDVYAIKMRNDGRRFWFWPNDGLAVCAAPGFQFEPQVVSDGNSGMIVTWEDYRAGLADASVYAKRLSWLGVWPNYWGTNGVPVSNAAGNQQFPSLSGTGDIVVAWEDSRNGNADIYAQRIEIQGTLGNNAPAPAAGPTQGDPPSGTATLSWTASALDDAGATPLRVGTYRVWQDVFATAPSGEPPVAATPVREAELRNALTVPTHAPAEGDDGQGFDPSMLPVEQPGESDGREWRVIATLPADGSAIYSLNVALQNANGTSGYGLFRVEAVEISDDTIGWMSEWIELTSTATASVELPGASTGLLLAPPHPNPSRGTTQIEFALPDASPATVLIYSADGRRVRELVRAELSSGPHTATWNGLDAGGRRVAAGVYFVRVEAAGIARTRRITLLD